MVLTMNMNMLYIIKGTSDKLQANQLNSKGHKSKTYYTGNMDIFHGYSVTNPRSLPRSIATTMLDQDLMAPFNQLEIQTKQFSCGEDVEVLNLAGA